jgi:hypothetical protein
MMKIAITRTDGGVSIISLAPGADVVVEVDKWKESSPGQYVSHQEFGQPLPDKALRNAWSLSGSSIACDRNVVISLKAAEIKAERDRRKGLGVAAAGKWFHSDDGSRIQQLGLVMMGAGVPSGLEWKTLDGSFVTMTPTLAMQIFAATAASDQGLFACAESHRAAMSVSADPSSYDHLTGWPLAYGE